MGVRDDIVWPVPAIRTDLDLRRSIHLRNSHVTIAANTTPRITPTAIPILLALDSDEPPERVS